MRRCTRKRVLAIVTALAVSSGVTAAPVITRTDFYTDFFGPSVIDSRLGASLHLDVGVESPYAPAQMNVFARYSLDSAIGRTLFYYSGPIFAGKNFDRNFTPTTLLSAWSLFATDPDGTSTTLIPGIAEPEFLPLVQNLRVIQSGTTPNVVWDLPDLTNFDVDRIRVRIFDVATREAIFQSASLAPVATNYVVPSGVLDRGRTYEFRVSLEDLKGSAGEPVRGLENRSNAFTGAVSIPEPGTLALLALGLAGLAVAHRRKQ